MYWLIIAVLVLAMYGALKLHALGKGQLAIAEFLERIKQETEASDRVDSGLPYGWFDDGWPVKKLREDETAPLSNPELRITADEYAIGTWMVEYQSLKSATERKAFLRKLKVAEISLSAEFLDVVFSDESATVRAWAAGHLPTTYKDYSDVSNPVQTRDYEPAILADPEPVVRAGLWSNPECERLPFSRFLDIKVQSDWKEKLLPLSHLERLGLMRNPRLSKHLVLALLESSSDELGISRNEHAQIVTAAALNPDLIGSSRFNGRDYWVVQDDPNPPFEEFGKMWDLCLDKWMEDQGVAYTYLSYIQTTPKKKLQTYIRLNDAEGDRHKAMLREAVVRSCDPLKDKEVLKLAWEDSEEDCRKAARERIGNFTEFVGVS